ncbi:beta-1,3-galactosyltransferase 1 isoform X3 [Pundamilia nyererei]|uniref:Hexosyltransferase n=1 Tax=Pundamilia nyererei TaxID=303518 RepID=A0A9Y3VVH5_9CICH|nr:PREDICTED: beta-1,3-galactosyltransferase 1-like isoform X3 [Pundamilia nyererei]
MRATLIRRLVKLLSAAAVLALTAHILASSLSKQTPEPSPLPPEEYRLVDPQTYRYLLNQPSVCRHRSPFLLFMVPVGAEDAAAREAIRKTWSASGRDTLTLFFVGIPQRPQMSALQQKLEEESRQHADIVQWLRNSPKENFITGSVIQDGRPRREPNSKWYVSEELYPEESFPSYVSGAGYVFSADLAARISWASRFVRVIPLEDVYVGLCLRMLGVRPVYAYSLPFFRSLFEIKNLKYDRCTFAKLIIVNGFKAPKLLRVWQDFAKSHERC